MAGVLLYTSTTDSDGSLGGLVALGEPQNLGPLFEQALAGVRKEFADAGKTRVFDRLKMFLAEEARPGDYATAAAAVVLLIFWETITAGFRLLPMPYFPSPASVVQSLIQQVDDMSGLPGNSLHAKLDAAAKQIQAGKPTPAANLLQAFLNEVEAIVGSGRMSAADAEPLRLAVGRVIRSITR